MPEDKDRLRTTFDRVAALYDEVRPDYPRALFDDVVSWSGVFPDGRMLEVGCGTGKATVPLARRGYGILCIELGENLATIARQNLISYPQAEVRVGAFEDWPPEEVAFDLAVSAEAFHWIDPDIGYQKIAQALRPHGAIALFWNRHIQSAASRGFFEAVDTVYEREAPELADPSNLPTFDEVRGRADELERTGFFDGLTTRKYSWEAVYDTAGYLRLLSTYSGHINLEVEVRERLFRGIADLIDGEFGGRISKGYATVLYLARKK